MSKTVDVIYRPQAGGKYFSPGLKPGAVITVSVEQAKSLLASGQFEKQGLGARDQGSGNGKTDPRPPTPDTHNPPPKKKGGK